MPLAAGQLCLALCRLPLANSKPQTLHTHVAAAGSYQHQTCKAHLQPPGCSCCCRPQNARDRSQPQRSQVLCTTRVTSQGGVVRHAGHHRCCLAVDGHTKLHDFGAQQR
jgi:hypothetical protein